MRLTEQLVKLVFPSRCAGCQQLGAIFCAACRARVQAVPRPLCVRCGRPVLAGGRCRECRHTRFAVSAIRSAGVYDQPLSTAIHQFKYQGRRELARPLGQLLVDYWQGRSVSCDAVVDVPLYPRRLRERGYNQARLLAIEFCRSLKLPLLNPDFLCRERETKQQMTLSLAERRRNVIGAFAWHGPRLAGERVLLIDDVATSGSTLEACGQALLDAGAGTVWALTGARAFQQHSTEGAAVLERVTG